MTELATPPTEQQPGRRRASATGSAARVRRGRRRAARARCITRPKGASGPAEVDFASDGGVDRSSRRRPQRRLARLARGHRLSRRVEVMFRAPGLFVQKRPPDLGAAHHVRARQGALGRTGRDRSRHRDRRVRLRRGGPDEGRLSENAATGIDVYSIRQPLASSRHHALQLPRDGADVVFSISPSPAATPSSSSPPRGPAVGDVAWRSCYRGRPPRGVFNVVHGDKVAVDALLEHPTCGRLLCRLDPDRPTHL